MNTMLERICRKSQKDLKKYVANALLKTHPHVYVEDGFVFAPGDFPVLLVAHLDTVHKTLPNEIIYTKNKDIVTSPQGIGGDDRCGVYMILNIIKQYNCSVLFCEDEEIGCIGAEKFTISDVANGLKFNYMIELDRKGEKDAVFYECDNPEFEAFITKEHFITDAGSLSDISILAPHFGCAAVNLSCGYYNAHTTTESVVLSEMERNIEEVLKILDRTTPEDAFEYIEADSRYGYGWDIYGFGKKKYTEAFYIIMYQDQDETIRTADVYASSEAEAIGEFMMDHPDRCFNDIIDLYAEEM